MRRRFSICGLVGFSSDVGHASGINTKCTKNAYVPGTASVPTGIVILYTTTGVDDTGMVNYMFTALFNQDVSEWNVANVWSMDSMFAGASAFNQDISDWNVANVSHMTYIFYRASAFNQDISRLIIKEIYI